MILNNNYEYEFIIRVDSEEVFKKSVILGQVAAEDKEQQEKDKQLELQEEQNKTNKGIWETLKEVLSYINPLSENFFVYKLLDLLFDGIKWIVLPSDDFFVEFVTDMNDFLSERLGILYYPVDLVVDFLTRVSTLDESGTAIISWGSFNFMGADLIKAGSYNLNELVSSNETLNNVHSIYLVFVDVILWLGLLILSANTFVDVFGGKYLDDNIQSGYEAYDRYKKEKNAEKKSNFIGFRK